ncbi:SMP-30/gluconolactonase/LRE family protein [Amycolatopsis pithecellobii]|uniref:Gluconolactonase n=1 Tax=Amycolatopsis pithecellobii TaxID=664692 RepID=A0A6N7YW50_9PSEU|nr:SMP-30/gluconolactonase/LRE family protein [Amycolatopsis pithecellobii]MTD57285.1 gluconolactonase [Amycolatopsis pithecellobii]
MDMKTYARGLTWGEGPRFHHGALWVSDPQGGTIWTDSTGSWTASPQTSQPNGLWFLPDGRLTGAIIRERRVGVWDGSGFAEYADLKPVATGPLGDMVGDADGGLYVDDVGFAPHLGEKPRPGRIIYVAPDGTARIAADDVVFPNGLALIDGGRTLVVAETSAQRLVAYDVLGGGRLAGRRVFADLAELVGPEARPDGLCAAPDGVWACTLTGKAVVLVTADGVRTVIGTDDASPIACCTDGDSRLFVTLAHSDGRPVMDAVADKTVRTTVEVVDLVPAPPTDPPIETD